MQIKICAEYRDMLPRTRLVCQEPGLRPIGRSPGVPDKSNRGLGSMSRYSAQILICFIAYIFIFFCLFLSGFGRELCRTAITLSALCHCPLLSEWGWPLDNQNSQHALLKCSWPWKYSLAFMPKDRWNWQIQSISMGSLKYKNQENGEVFLHACE